MTSKKTKTPQRGNTDVGKDGVRNPGRFASNKSSVTDPTKRLYQLYNGYETDDERQAAFDEATLANNNTWLDEPATHELIVERFRREGIRPNPLWGDEPGLEVSETKIVVKTPIFDQENDLYCFSEEQPDCWLDLTDEQENHYEEHPETFLYDIENAKQEWVNNTIIKLNRKVDAEKRRLRVS